MRILVTGATGYLGARAAEHLADEGHEVVALMRTRRGEGSQWEKKMARIITGDIRESGLLEEAAGLDPEAVVHTVSLDHNQSEVDPSNTCRTNVASTWRLLNLLAPRGLKRFIYFSTQQVYGRTGPIVITETTPPMPLNAYGLTHLMSEQVCELFNRKTDVTCLSLRISNGFGAPVFPSCNCWWLVINDFCKTALEKGEIRLSSDGTPQRDFIHIGDIYRAVAFLLEQPVQNIAHGCYNLGGGETFTILELAHIAQDVCQRQLQREIPVIMPDKRISKDAKSQKTVDRFQYESTRLRSMGFQNGGSLQKGIAEVLSFLQDTG